MILKSTLPLLLVAAPIVGVTAATTTDATLAALRNTPAATSLATMRAGAPVVHTLGQDVRSELKRVDQKTGSLAAMRGGELTDHELLIIGLTALAILLLILIL